MDTNFTSLTIVPDVWVIKRSLPQSLMGSLAGLVRATNCYYSDLIEGHDTHPVARHRWSSGIAIRQAAK